MSAKEKYKALCEQVDMPLFLQYWWLEGVCAGRDWDVVIVHASDCGGEGNEIIGAMPYETDKWLWWRYIKPSDMTPYAGIWVREEVRKDEKLVLAIYKYVEKWLNDNKITSCHQRLFPDAILLEDVKESPFKLGRRATYIIDNPSNLDDVLSGFSRNKRKKLERLTLTYNLTDVEPEEFYRFHAAACRQKNKSISYTREMLLVIVEKAMLHNQCKLLGIRDADGELLAEGLMVWDSSMAYMLINTFDHDKPSDGAREKLTFEAIKQARSLGVSIDFTCSRDYLKNYGAKRRKVYSVHYGSLTFVAVQRFIDWIKR